MPVPLGSPLPNERPQYYCAALSEVRFDLNSLDDKINKYDKTLNWPMTKKSCYH